MGVDAATRNQRRAIRGGCLKKKMGELGVWEDKESVAYRSLVSGDLTRWTRSLKSPGNRRATA